MEKSFYSRTVVEDRRLKGFPVSSSYLLGDSDFNVPRDSGNETNEITTFLDYLMQLDNYGAI